MTAAPEGPEVIAEATKAFVHEDAGCRVHITKRSLEKFGYTPRCPARAKTPDRESASEAPHTAMSAEIVSRTEWRPTLGRQIGI